MTPTKRFPEFSGDWLPAKLGDFFTFKNGVNADKSMYGRGRKFINVMDVIAEGPIYHDAIIGSVEVSDKEFAKNEVRYGDILFQRSSETREEVGQSNIYLDEKSATFGGFVIRGHAKETIVPRYFDALLKTSAVRKDMTSRSGGSTRYNIGQAALDAVTICVAPSHAEQQKISEFVATVDERIKLLKLRLSALQSYKLGVATNLFSQKLRFKRDDGFDFPKWRRGKLGDVFVERRERGAVDASLLSVSQTVGVVPYDESARRNNSSEDKALYKSVLEGDIAYNSMRMWQGASGLANLSGIVSPAYTVVVPKNHNDGYYWASAFKASEMVHLFTRYSQGLTSDTWTLKFPAFSQIAVDIPDPQEQRKIGGFLKALDNKITACSDQIDQMQTFKNGLLQQMFV